MGHGEALAEIRSQLATAEERSNTWERTATAQGLEIDGLNKHLKSITEQLTGLAALVAQKAEQDTVAELASKVEGKADQDAVAELTSTVDGKADQGAVADLANAIQDKADKTALAKLTSTVENNVYKGAVTRLSNPQPVGNTIQCT